MSLTARTLRALVAALAGAALCAAPASATTTELGALPHDNSQPAGVAVDADGNVWFAELDLAGTGRIGELTVDGKLAEFPLPAGGSEPTSIVAGPDGNMWFTESGIDRIGKITPAGVVTDFGGLVGGASPQDMTVGPDGALWFTEGGYNRGNRIGRIDPASGAVTEFCIRGCDRAAYTADTGLNPSQIVTGPDGRLWFTESNPDRGEGAPDPYQDQGTGYVAAMTTSGSVSEYALPTLNGRPQGITVGPDGNLWFTENGTAGNRVGTVTTGGQVNEFAELPTPASRPGRIISPGDGHLWLAEGDGNRLAVLDTDGHGTELPELPTAASKPVGLAADKAGHLWISELGGNQLAMTTVELPPDERPATTTTAGPTQSTTKAPPSKTLQASAIRAGLGRVLAPIVRALRRRGTAHLAGLRVTLAAPAAGTVTLVLASGRTVLARARATFKAQGSHRARLVLTRAGTRRFRRHRAARVTLTATFAPTRGRRVTATRSVLLRP